MGNIILLFILILVNAFFAATEMAFVSLNDNRVDFLAEEGNSNAKTVQGMLKEPTRFLSTIQIGITLAGFLNSAFAADSFSEPVSNFIIRLIPSMSASASKTIAMVVITILLAVVQIVLGELVPKRVAMKNAERYSFAVAKIMKGLSVASLPLVKLLTLLTNIFLRIIGIDPSQTDSEISEEEIRMMVDAGQEKGGISTNERLMINNIFDFDNMEVSDIMTHRTEVAAISIDATITEVSKLVDEEKYTRYPVYQDSLDNVVGVLHVKDLFALVLKGTLDSFSLKDIIRIPYFVPDSKKTDELFYSFQRDKVHIAIVIDEYGGTAGVVTMEDLIEEIVGEVFDEYDDEETPEYHKINDDEYICSGSIDLDDVKELLKLDLPIDEYDTLSGFMIGMLGYLPNTNDHSIIEFSGYQFEIISVEDKVIKEVKIRKIAEEKDAE